MEKFFSNSCLLLIVGIMVISRIELAESFFGLGLDGGYSLPGFGRLGLGMGYGGGRGRGRGHGYGHGHRHRHYEDNYNMFASAPGMGHGHRPPLANHHRNRPIGLLYGNNY